MGYDFSLKPAIVEVDRDADRRWSFATDKMKLAEDKGETFSDSAPLEDASMGLSFGKRGTMIGLLATLRSIAVVHISRHRHVYIYIYIVFE